MLKVGIMVILILLIILIIGKKLWEKKNLKKFFSDDNKNYIPDGIEEINQDIKDLKGEVQHRSKRIKEELSDIKLARKNLIKQTGDVFEVTVKHTERKGRKKKEN